MKHKRGFWAFFFCGGYGVEKPCKIYARRRSVQIQG
jgi:hypothetical protein